MKAQSVLLLVSVVLCMAGGQVLFKYVAIHLREIDLSTAIGMLRATAEPWLWSAIGIYGLTTVLWLLLLRGEDLSRVYPFAVAMSILLVLIASSVLFGEIISTSSLVGIAVIFTGLCILTVF